MKAVAWLAVLVVVAGSSAWGQSITSIKTDGNIETDLQLVSKVALGTAPLVVASKTLVVGLNADLLDNINASSFALAVELLAAIESLDNPDPPCFDSDHRFVNCGNGTVTDTATGVIWLENPGCLAATLDYATANQTAATLYDGATIDDLGADCGLADGSRLGDWRLATREEWEGVLDEPCTTTPKIVGNATPLPGCFGDNAGANEWAAGVAATGYWSSSANPGLAEAASRARLTSGDIVDNTLKTVALRVWPVRGGKWDRRIKSVSCPTDEFVTGFDEVGNLVCASIP